MCENSSERLAHQLEAALDPVALARRRQEVEGHADRGHELAPDAGEGRAPMPPIRSATVIIMPPWIVPAGLHM